jgi:hypothetical protein
MTGMSDALAYVAAAIVFVWGVLHAIPTRNVVAGFGDISPDNRLVITQEWLAEAMTMWFIAAITVVVTAAGDSDAVLWIYRTSAAMLFALAAVTTLTGARTPVIWFKICPFLQSGAAMVLVAASFE